MLRELTDGEEWEGTLLVRAAEPRTARDGRPLLRLRLADRSGTVAAVVREPSEQDEALFAPGAAVRVAGSGALHPRYGAQLELTGWRAPREEEIDPAQLEPGPERPVAELEADLRALVATVREHHLRALLDALLGPASATWPAFRDAPAAKHYHEAYRHGLLEHTLAVARGVSALAETFPGIDRDLAVTGALVHDIGKLDAYAADGAAIELTDDGRLQGEIALGYFRVRRLIEEIGGFPPLLARALLHVVLSHHGSLAHGSPVVPATREATLVHMVDNLGGRLGSFDRLERALAPGAAWSPYDKAIGGGAWFPARGEAGASDGPAAPA
nr:HD domain-containing protein [Conexibacter arvalis]